MREIMRDYTATGKYKSENIPGNQFMEEHEREFFDKNAFVLERQAALLAENYRSGQDDSLYDFIADLEEHEGEYVVDGALLTCTRCSKHARKVKIDGAWLAGELQDVEKNSRIYTGDRPQTINGLVPAGVKDCIGGMRGEEMRAKGEGEETGEVNIVSFGNCTFIPQGEELNKILLAQNLMHKKDKIIEAIEGGKGTCYCFMKLNEEWENLAIAGEYMAGEMTLPKAGIEKALLSASYMKFNGVEGINMLSILFCQFGGGIITALESGQDKDISPNWQNIESVWNGEEEWNDEQLKMAKYITTVLLSRGYSNEIIAGLVGNIVNEGGFGKFESSLYSSGKPKYLEHMDSVHGYGSLASGQYLYDLGIEVLVELRKNGNCSDEKHMFGLGAVQWTGDRGERLIEKYIETFGEDGIPSKEECTQVEIDFMIQELENAGSDGYKKVINKCGQETSNIMEGTKKVEIIAEIIMSDYESPSSTDATKRQVDAKVWYEVLVGNE